jgi:hypothetical protein
MGSPTSSKRGILLTTFGLAFATAAIVTTSECTTSAPPRGEDAGMKGGAGGATVSEGTGGSIAIDGSSWLAPPETPAEIAAPTGAIVAAHLRGVGVQIYVCMGAPGSGGGGAGGGGAGGGTGTPPGYAWTFTAPDAQLLDADGTQLGLHSAGPTWTSSTDGSAVVGMKVSQADAPLGTAIPWLLLRAKSTSGMGLFSTVTFIQRVNTVGGKAPASGCDSGAAGTESRVSYSADYFFYQEGAAPPAGSGGATSP